jgi:hypothetical protein
MKSFREQTYYELLEVEHSAPPDAIRSALQRALEVYAAGSVALYALVEEAQAEALRNRLQEAARVLLDPAARAGYDRMLGLEAGSPAGEQTLWSADEDENDAAISEGLYPRTETAALTAPARPPPPSGVQATMALEGPPARWPSAEPVGDAHPPPPGLPAPTQRPLPPAFPSPLNEARGRGGGLLHPPRARAPTEAAREVPAPAAPVGERPRMPDLPPDVEFNGELLRQVREARGLTLVQVAERTRIGRSHLEKVEADRYADLPPTVYLRGILVSLARELKLDATRVSKSYMLLAARSAPPES